MPVQRVSIPKIIWAKLQTQAGKSENKDLKDAIAKLKTSTGPAGAVVVWDPPQLFIKRAHAVLVHEEGFTRDRQKGGCNHQAMLKTIADLKKLIEPEAA